MNGVMSIWKGAAALGAIALAALALAACGGGDSEETAAAETTTAAPESQPAETGAPADTGAAETAAADGAQFVIGYNAPTSLPFDVALQKAMQLQADKLGVEFVVAGGTFDPNEQLAAFNSLVDRGVDAIIAFPIDPLGMQPAIDRAVEQGIKVVDVITPGLQNVLTHVRSNDREAAAALVEYAVTQLDGPCKVGIIQGLSVVPVLNERNLGYEEGAKAAGCEILDQQESQDDQPATATAIANTWKTKFGDEMNLILAYNDPTAFGAIAATGADWSPKVVGMNGDDPNIQAVKDGQQLADGAVDMPAIGNAILYAAYLALTGEELPPNLDSDITIVTPENVAEYKTYDERLKSAMDVEFVEQSDGSYLIEATGGE
jgi:ribose transport system substrate-binding protein